MRVLGSGRSDKNDPNDARSVAIAALHQPGLVVVRPEDHTQVLRMLVKRHLELTALRTQAACRLHAVILQLRPGGITRRLSATKAARMLQGMRNLGLIGEQRRTMARTHLVDIRRLDREIKANKVLISKAVAASGTTVTDVYGVGPIVAAFLIGYTGDIGRFASASHYASYNGTAPIEVSSGGKKRHRLSMRGNRKLNHAIHMAAITQIRNGTPGRVYGTLTAVLNHAVLHDLIARSPCRGIRLPAVQPVERRVVSPDELLGLAEALGPEYEAMAYLGAVLGLRWGECAGLRVGRIDLRRSSVLIAEQITRGAGGRSVPGPPKSAAGRRTLAIPQALIDLLLEHLERRGIAEHDSLAFVFGASDGEHLDYSNWLHRIWYPAREQAGLKWLQFHDLRRANATGLVHEGVDLKTAQTRLGHTDPRLTLAIYTQATTEADRQAAELLGERFLPRRDQGRGRSLA